MLVSWIEDWKFPILNEMGPVEISLWHTDVSSPPSALRTTKADEYDVYCRTVLR